MLKNGTHIFKNKVFSIYTNNCVSKYFPKNMHIIKPFIIEFIKPNYIIYVSTVMIEAFCISGELNFNICCSEKLKMKYNQTSFSLENFIYLSNLLYFLSSMKQTPGCNYSFQMLVSTALLFKNHFNQITFLGETSLRVLNKSVVFYKQLCLEWQSSSSLRSSFSLSKKMKNRYRLSTDILKIKNNRTCIIKFWNTVTFKFPQFLFL